jgi:Leucine-rich repeat (LRR) protein
MKLFKMLAVTLIILLSHKCSSLEVSVECERDMVGIICTFPDNAVSNSSLEITSVIVIDGMSSDEIENEDIVEIVVDKLSEFMPRNIGSHFKKIENLVIQSSDLKYINRSDFRDSNLTQLEVLSLFNNKIESIPHDAFYDLPLLRHLDIENNLISFLEPELLTNSINLHVFAAGSNLIEEIHENFFTNNHRLWKVMLNDNQIVDFRHNFMLHIDKSENLRYFDLERNPGYSCFCALHLGSKVEVLDVRVAVINFQGFINSNCSDIDG